MKLKIIVAIAFALALVGGVGTCLLADICNIVICICGVLCLTRSVREECKATLRGAK